MRRLEAEAGVALIRQGIAGLLEVGSRLSISRLTAYVAAAQQREGAIVVSLLHGILVEHMVLFPKYGRL